MAAVFAAASDRMPVRRWLSGAILLLASCTLTAGTTTAEAQPQDPQHIAVTIALDGAIGPATADYVTRSLAEADERHAAVAILRIDTPGGLLSAMRSIIRAMLASPVPVIVYVAPSGARAASAGTYILYASALAAMAPGTNLGAATPVALGGGTPLPGPAEQPTSPPADNKEPQPAGPAPGAEATKITNDSVAYIRALADMHGRNAAWAERAVREAVSLPYDEALARHVIELVASSEADVLAKADGRQVIVQGKPVRLATKGLAIVAVEPDWRDRLLGLLSDPNLISLLLLGGVVCLLVELTHPGLIAPGVIGVICLLVGGYGLNLLPIDYAGLALAVLGLGLMITEIFVPAFGALILGGGTALVIGSLMMFEAPAFRPLLWVVVPAVIVLALLIGLVFAVVVRAARRPHAGANAALLGAVGRITSWAEPEGEILVVGERWQARLRSPGEALLEPGGRAKVVGREGLTLYVEPVPDNAPVPADPAAGATNQRSP